MIRGISTLLRHSRTGVRACRSQTSLSNARVQSWQNCRFLSVEAEALAEEPTGPIITQTVVSHPTSTSGTSVSDSANAGAGADNKFAVIALSGKQFKCVEDDLLICDRQKVDIGEEVTFDQVLLVGTPDQTVVGRPLVQSATVRAVCEQHPKDKKVIVFKKKRRKGYRRKNGFRRQLTVFRVLEINDGSSS